MDAWVKKIGRNKGSPRIFLDGVQAVRAGFSPGQNFDVEVDGQRVTIMKKDDGSRVVTGRSRNGRVQPVIDINSKKLLDMFAGMDSIRVVVTANAVYLLPLASEVKRVKRLDRLRSRIQNSEPIRTGSVSHGGGVLTHAIHRGLLDGGLESTLALANEIREDLLVHAIEKNDCWNDQTMALALPMQELVQDEWLMDHLQPVELLEMGIPCSGASKAGVAKKGLTMMEDHEHVGHLVASAIAIINKVQPVTVLVENVPDYSRSASAQILRYTLRDMGYDTHEAILKGRDYHALEDRVRWVMVACTRGLDFNIEDIQPPQGLVSTVRDILDPEIGPDSPLWRPVTYLKEKRERDEAKGSGFKNQYIDPESSKVPVLRAGYNKSGSTDPRLPHPTDANLSRLLTAHEHARVKGVPVGLIDGLSETNAHQLLGQGVVYDPFRAVGLSIAQAMQRFATQDSMRAAIVDLVQMDAASLHEGIGKVTIAESTWADLPAGAMSSIANGQDQAWHDPVTNTTVFLVDRIQKGRERAVFLHEIIHRHGRSALPEGALDALIGQVKKWAGQSDGSPERTIHDAALSRAIDANVEVDKFDEELFAYAVEEAVVLGVVPRAAAAQENAEAWLAQVVVTIQMVGEKLLGNALEDLTVQDVVDLSYALAQLESPEYGWVVREAIRSSIYWAPDATGGGMEVASEFGMRNDSHGYSY